MFIISSSAFAFPFQEPEKGQAPMAIFSQLLDQNSLIFSLISLLLTFILTKWFIFKPKSSKNFPPSPPKLPILGHLHKLGLYPHHSLQAMARQHGPIMLLHLGSVPTLVVSSPSAAEVIMKAQDLIFASRPKSKVNKRLLYDYKDLSVAPYGEYWRQLKSICTLQLLSKQRVQSTRVVREEEVNLLIKKITSHSQSECCSGTGTGTGIGTGFGLCSSNKAVNLSDLFMSLTNDVVCRAAFGRKYSDGESGVRFRKLMKEFVGLLGGFDIGTFIPRLGWMNWFTGLDGKLDKVATEMDEFLESVVEEHLERAKRVENSGGKLVEDGEAFVGVLMRIYQNKDKASGFCIDRDSVKALLLDIFAGGTDTTYTVLEWVMTELLRQPQAMEKVQREVRQIARGKSSLTESELEKMHYLKAVIKETLRLHPPIPLLIPREASQDVNIMGYDIAAGTMVIINAYAIGRDPKIWDEPNEFKPERFLDSSMDFRGHDFELIPFGSGRRSCPGISFAMATNEAVLASILAKFDWELPDGMKGEDLDMTECTGLTIHRKIPLLAVPTPFTF